MDSFSTYIKHLDSGTAQRPGPEPVRHSSYLCVLDRVGWKGYTRRIRYNLCIPIPAMKEIAIKKTAAGEYRKTHRLPVLRLHLQTFIIVVLIFGNGEQIIRAVGHEIALVRKIQLQVSFQGNDPESAIAPFNIQYIR